MKRLVATGGVIWAMQNRDQDREFLPEARQIAANYALVFGKWESDRGFVRIDEIENLPVAEIESAYSVQGEADTHAYLALRAPMLQREQAQRWLTSHDGGHSKFARTLLNHALRPVYISAGDRTGAPYLRFGSTPPNQDEFRIASKGQTFTLTCQVEPDTIRVMIHRAAKPKDIVIELSSTFAV